MTATVNTDGRKPVNGDENSPLFNPTKEILEKNIYRPLSLMD
jgi:hypothetical protein